MKPKRTAPTTRFEQLEARRLLATTYSILDLGQSAASAAYDAPGIERMSNSYFSGSGLFNAAGQQRAVRLTGVDAASAILLEPATGYNHTTSHDVSDIGAVVGLSYNSPDAQVATIWTNGKGTSLGAGVARGVSDNGSYVVGVRKLRSGILNVDHAFIFGKKENDLGSLGGLGARALDVNNSGKIVGAAKDGIGKIVAFFWDGSKMIDIAPQYETGQANAISNKGIVVGDVDNHPFSYNSATKAFKVLSVVSGDGSLGTGIALDVSEGGVIVGYTNRKKGPHATVWQGGVPFDLNKLIPAGTGWELLYAKSVNEKGQIIAVARDSQNNGRTLLLQPNQSRLDSGGTLRIAGTPVADVVSVSLKSNRIFVTVNGGTQKFVPSSVKRLSIDLGEGSDKLTIGASIPAASIFGRGGNDSFSVRNSKKDAIDGGAGTDKGQFDSSDTRTSIETVLA